MNKKETYTILDHCYKIKNKISNKAIKQCMIIYDITKNVNKWLKENNLPYCWTITKPISNTNIKKICEINKYFTFSQKIIIKKNKNVIYICLAKEDMPPIVLSYITYNENNTTQTILLPKNLTKYQYLCDITKKFASLPEWYFTFITTNTKNFYLYTNETIKQNTINSLQSYLTCPRHFIDYVNEHSNNYNYINNFEKIEQLLDNFTIETKVKTLNTKLQLFVNNCLKNTLNTQHIKQLVTRLDILTILYKLSLNSIKQWKISDIAYSSSFSSIITFCFENDNYNTILDTNRDIEYNNELIEKYQDEEQNKMISKQQEKIKELDNQLFLRNYVLKVPLNIKDLIDEGKQQNNCVGSYYNKQIAKGETKIIFIRKKDKPDKSYITCQLNEKGHIIQARIKNNYTNNKVVFLQNNLSTLTEDFYLKNIL